MGAVLKKRTKAKAYKLSPTEMISVEKRDGVMYADLCVECADGVTSRSHISYVKGNLQDETILFCCEYTTTGFTPSEARDLYELLSVTKPWEKK